MSSRRDAIEQALRSFDWIDIGNHPGDDEQYAEVADTIEAAVADWEDGSWDPPMPLPPRPRARSDRGGAS